LRIFKLVNPWQPIRLPCSPNLSDPVSYLANQRFVFISLRKKSPERKWERLPQPWDLTMFILEKRKDLLGGNGCSEKLTNGAWPLWCTRIPRTNFWQSGTGLRLRENDSAASAMIRITAARMLLRAVFTCACSRSSKATECSSLPMHERATNE
jgi:hypothetical protein